MCGDTSPKIRGRSAADDRGEVAGTLGVDSREVARLAAGNLAAWRPVADVRVDCQVVLLREVGCQVVLLQEAGCQEALLPAVLFQEAVLPAAEYLDGYRHPVGQVDCLSRALMDVVEDSAGSLPPRLPAANRDVCSDAYPAGRG